MTLKIGTRVRIDDKALAWHDDVGTIVRVPERQDMPVESITRGDFVAYGRRGGKTALGIAIHEAIAAGYLDAGGIPRHMLAGTEPAGLGREPAGLNPMDVIAPAGARYTPEQIRNAYSRGAVLVAPEPTCSLKIGTRVRIDDKALAWHDDVGVIVRVPGPGDAPDLYDVRLDGGTLKAHRAQLALVDDTLVTCDACKGSGQVPVFTSVAECTACGGSGVVP